MSMAAAGFPGFVNAEVNALAAASASDRPQWRSVQQFRSANDLQVWRRSEQYRRLLQDAKTLVDASDPTALSEEEAKEGYADGTVSEVITTRVKPGKDREYQEWVQRINRAEAQFIGYRGGFLQPPVSEQQPCWMSLVRFATPDQLDAWLNSDVRRRLLVEHEALVESWEHHRTPSSFAGWFPERTASGEAPAAWKQSMLVILCLFPIVMLEMRFLSPLLSKLNSSGSTFIGNVISVSLLAWPFMPLVIGRMNWWLTPRKDGWSWINPVGVLLILAVYALETTIFSRAL